MNAKNEVVIRISPDQQRIRVENTNGGVISCKEITEQTFYDCIKQSVRNEEVQSGFLPANCFHVGIENDGSHSYCLWYPELYADISYFGTEYPNFPLPRLVFGFHVSKEGKVFSCKLGVVEDKPPAEDVGIKNRFGTI